MGYIFRLPNGQLRLLEKGASEMVLLTCDKFHNFEGSITQLTPELKEEIEGAIVKMAE